MISHTEEKEMLAAHALDALDERDARRVEEHLATCAECRAELEEWRETASTIALSVKAAEPSSELRSKIMESVRAEKVSQPVESQTAPKAAGKVEREASSNVIPMPRRSWGRAQVFSAIAASIALIALSTSLFLLWRLNETRRELAKYQTAVEVLAKQAAEERAARQLLTSPQAQSAMLAGTSKAPAARAQLSFDKSTGHAMLFASGLPPAPAGHAYQLWFISGTKVMPGKVFTPDSSGSAMMSEQVPVSSLGTSPIFAVTLEPAGGVQIPTGEKYLLSPTS